MNPNRLDPFGIRDRSISANRHAKAGILRKCPLGLRWRENSYACGSTNLNRVMWIIDAVQGYSVLTRGLYKDQRTYDIGSAGECMGLTLGKKHDVAHSNV